MQLFAKEDDHPAYTFDAAKHLNYEPPHEKLSMEDLGLSSVQAPSKIGVTAPFPLATLEGVTALRNDILQPRVLSNHMMQSKLAGAHCQLRGMAPEAARFVFDFWTNPATIAAVSEAAGEELIPVFDYELGHTNIQIPHGQDRRKYVESLPIDPYGSLPKKEEYSAEYTVSGKNGTTAEEKTKVVGYHRDAYQWVCVLMLSDVSNMVGGETEIRKGDGSTIKAIGPSIGSCVMMQGGYIEHCALPCIGTNERITMVTSFRSRGKIIQDITDLENIKSCSNHHEVYDQYTRSCLDVIQEALEAYRLRLCTRRHAIEDAFGRRGGLKQPTINLDELRMLKEIVNGTFSNALLQMSPDSDNHSNKARL